MKGINFNVFTDDQLRAESERLRALASNYQSTEAAMRAELRRRHKAKQREESKRAKLHGGE